LAGYGPNSGEKLWGLPHLCGDSWPTPRSLVTIATRKRELQLRRQPIAKLNPRKLILNTGVNRWGGDAWIIQSGSQDTDLSRPAALGDVSERCPTFAAETPLDPGGTVEDH